MLADKFICAACHQDLKQATCIVKCATCPDYFLCMKCSTVERHNLEHQLAPFVLERAHQLPSQTTEAVVDDNDDDESEGSVLVPATALSRHGRNASEMEAQLPVEPNESQHANEAMRCGGPNPPEVMEQHPAVDLIQECRKKHGESLILKCMQLTKIPEEIFAQPMTHITTLDLTGNGIVELPREISLLSGMQRLILGNNQLRELPEAVGDLTNLQFLDVSHNELHDLPATFLFLEELETIAMDFNSCAELPKVVLDMPWLRYLYIAENHRICAWPEVAQLQNFTSLCLTLDNEPILYKEYLEIRSLIRMITVNWNKIFPDEIIPGLFCGSMRCAQNPHVYQRLRISCVLTVGALEPNILSGMKHETVAVATTSFETAIAFIDDAMRNSSGCLVHCFSGMSRSPSILIAYLMKRRGMRLDEAYCVTKKACPAIYPNVDVFNQLVAYDAQLFPNAQRPLDMASMERDVRPFM